jgi:hypothetical protein
MSLQPTDEPDDDAAEEQTKSWIEKDFSQQLAGEDSLLCAGPGGMLPSGCFRFLSAN